MNVLLLMIAFTFSIFLNVKALDINSCANLTSGFPLTATLNLINNIDCQGQAVLQIGDDANQFKGKVIGNNFYISNLVVNISSTYFGLFSGTNVSVSDLTLKNVTVIGSGAGVGALFGECTGKKNQRKDIFNLQNN